MLCELRYKSEDFGVRLENAHPSLAVKISVVLPLALCRVSRSMRVAALSRSYGSAIDVRWDWARGGYCGGDRQLNYVANMKRKS